MTRLPPRRRITAGCALATLALLAGAGCRGQTSVEPPIVPLRNMYDQARYNAQAYSNFFPDHRTMRTPVEGTVPRERQIDPEIGRGRLPDDSGYVLQIPKPVVDGFGGMSALVNRGHDRFNIYCRPCHDGTGSGHGTVIERSGWQPAPPSFHQDRIRQMPDGQVFATITHGVRVMPSYGARIPVNDRWAIVSYVRALQLSQGE